MRRCAAILAVGLALPLGLAYGQVQHADAIASAVIHYQPSLPASLDQYAAPGNVIIVTAEQRNRNPDRIRAWRAKGAIVMAYVNLVDWPTWPLDPIQRNLYGGAFPQSWFYPGKPSNWSGTYMLNLSASSPVATYNGFTGTWGQYAVHWIKSNVIQDGSLFNGVFLDVWGERIWSLGIGGPGSDWEAGVARWGQELRKVVGPNIFVVGNNTQTTATAAGLNGRMWESFTSAGGGWNHLEGPNNGLVQTFNWPQWQRPQLDILWRNEANPSAATKQMLNAAAQRVSKTGTDVAVGSSNHQGGFPAPFGVGGGKFPPGSAVPSQPTPPTPPAKPAAPRPAGRASLRTTFGSGRMGVWRRYLNAGGRASAGGKAALSLAAGASGSDQAVLGTTARPSRRVTFRARIRITRAQLPKTGDRLLLSISGTGGARDVGIVRTVKGQLRWAAWTTVAGGGRKDLVIGKPVAIGRWLNVHFTTDWRRTRPRDVVRVGGRTVVATTRGSRPDASANSVWIGVGRSFTPQAGGPTSLLVRSAQMSTIR